MTFSTTGHSASLIPVFAYGPGAEEFSGIYDNTAIFNKIMKVTNWE
jgi:alkaline phosphatase